MRHWPGVFISFLALRLTNHKQVMSEDVNSAKPETYLWVIDLLNWGKAFEESFLQVSTAGSQSPSPCVGAVDLNVFVPRLLCRILLFSGERLCKHWLELSFSATATWRVMLINSFIMWIKYSQIKTALFRVAVTTILNIFSVLFSMKVCSGIFNNDLIFKFSPCVWAYLWTFVFCVSLLSPTIA